MEPEITLTKTTVADEHPLTPYQEYGGVFKMEKSIVMFEGHTVPLHNIAQVLSHPVKPKYLLKTIDMIKSLGAGLICFMLSNSYKRSSFFEDSYSPKGPGEWFVIIGLCCLAVFAYGIWERSRPPLHGFTIELVSGNYYPIVHKDKRFIDIIYEGFTQAIRENRDFEANFRNLTINQGKYAGITGATIIDGDNNGTVTGGKTFAGAS